MSRAPDVVIPPELVRPGLVWGRAEGKLFVYVTRASDLRCGPGIPSAIDGVPVVVRMIGAVRPAVG